MIRSSNLAGVLALPLAIALASCGGAGPAPGPGESSSALSEAAVPAAPTEAVPTPEAASQAPAMTSPVAPKAATGDPVRGPGGLEAKCLAAVADQVGLATRMVGTNRIDESQAAIDIYVNVPDATAPWKCHGYRNGKIDGVEFTGDEGRL